VGSVTDVNERQLAKQLAIVVTAFIVEGKVALKREGQSEKTEERLLHVFKLVGRTTVVKLLHPAKAFNNVVQLFCAEFIFTLINDVHEPKVLCNDVITYVVGIVIDVKDAHETNAKLRFTPLAEHDDGNTTFCN
jgi:hypothetical protein